MCDGAIAVLTSAFKSHSGWPIGSVGVQPSTSSQSRNLKGFGEARRRYPDVPVAVTLLYSERDWSRPAEREQVARMLSGVEWITLPDSGHFSALERPTDVARILLGTACAEISQVGLSVRGHLRND